jgi:hypothetical protein
MKSLRDQARHEDETAVPESADALLIPIWNIRWGAKTRCSENSATLISLGFEIGIRRIPASGPPSMRDETRQESPSQGGTGARRNYVHVENVLSLTRSILTLEGKECAEGNHCITGRSLADSPFDALTVG